MPRLTSLLIDVILVLAFLQNSSNFAAKSPLTLSSGLPRLFKTATAAAEPADHRSRAGPGRVDTLLEADLAKPAGQDWRVSQPPPDHSHCLHTGIV